MLAVWSEFEGRVVLGATQQLMAVCAFFAGKQQI